MVPSNKLVKCACALYKMLAGSSSNLAMEVACEGII